MPHVFTNGIRLAYERHGHGEPVVLVMGTGASGKVWTLNQTPALVEAGYQAITFDNRGIPPSDAPPGRYSLADMAGDTQGLLESLGVGPCRIVGVSLGAMIVQELLISSPHLVRAAVLIATRARADLVRTAYSEAYRRLHDCGPRPPDQFRAVVTALQMLSPATLNDDRAASLWLDTFELFSRDDEKAAGQLWADDFPDRRAALGRVTAPCRVVAFSDDLVTPPHLAAEVAEAIPDCDYVEVDRCGHYGYLERPDEVNRAMLAFLDSH
jgi:pimeloyl-ACP methyl ester carboxylesterase